MNETPEEKRARELRTTVLWLRIALLVGLAFVGLRYAIAIRVDGRWNVSGLVFIALTWAAAWFAAGFVFGFLFGIPKLSTAPDPSKTTAATAPGTTSDSGNSTASGLRPNSNLDEISDWLTKLLVGATLTQVVKIPSLVARAARLMSEGSGGIGSQGFATAILLYFVSIGFLSGYVLTRMFFSGAFARSDADVLSPQDKGTLNRASTSLDPTEHPDAGTLATANKTREIPITASMDAAVATAVASGSLLIGENTRAEESARIAVDKKPEDPRAHLNYAIALKRNGRNSNTVETELKRALEIVNSVKDAFVSEDIYNSIVYFYLYEPEPEGFTQAIAHGERFTSTNSPTRASIWINLACAYGQQYGYAQSHEETAQQLEEIKKKALQAMGNAIKLRPESAVRLRQLTTGIPDPADNDLEVFKTDGDFKKLVGLA